MGPRQILKYADELGLEQRIVAGCHLGDSYRQLSLLFIAILLEPLRQSHIEHLEGDAQIAGGFGQPRADQQQGFSVDYLIEICYFELPFAVEILQEFGA